MDGVHLGVHQRGADSSTPLVVTAPPTGFEPATFGTGNQCMICMEHGSEHIARMIPRVSERAAGYTRVRNEYTQ